MAIGKVSQKLDAVAKAKQAYVIARHTLEQRLRDEMRDELQNLQTQIDLTVRYAVDSGESKAAVLRALGTKDYATLNACLERTGGFTEITGTDPLTNVYYFADTGDKQILYVTYVDHGPDKFNGSASFNVKTLEDGRILLLAIDGKLWSDDLKTRNDVIAVLDGRTDGFYYEEAVNWVSAQ